MWFRLSIFHLCLTLAAIAQPLGKERQPHQLRLLCVEAAKGAEQLVVLEKADDVWVPRWRLKVSSNYLTDPLGFAGKTLALAIDPAPPPAEGAFNGPAKPISGKLEGVKPFHEFQLTEKGASTAVIIANPAEQAATKPYRVILLDADRSRFGAGRILVQNFAPAAVSGVLGGKRITVAPGRSEMVEPDADQAADMAQITLAWNDSGELRVFCDTRWPAKTDYRRYLLLLPKTDGTIQPFVFPEYPPFP